MADTLRTDYEDDVLDAEANEYRVYDIVDGNGNVVAANIHLEDKTVYSQTGDDYGSNDINEQNTFINGLKAAFSQTLTDLKATAIAQAVGVTVSDTFAQVIAKLGAIINRGKVTKTLSGGETYTIPEGYHNGQGTVSAPAQTGTYKPTQRKNNNDMGATNTYRYVDTTNVPNTNSQTYSVTSNGTKDMGETNIYRYVSVSVKPTYNSISPTGTASYITGGGGQPYDTGGCKITLGTPTISSDGKTITIPETINYGGYWFGVGSQTGASATRNIVVKLNI